MAQALLAAVGCRERTGNFKRSLERFLANRLLNSLVKELWCELAQLPPEHGVEMGSWALGFGDLYTVFLEQIAECPIPFDALVIRTNGYPEYFELFV